MSALACSSSPPPPPACTHLNISDVISSFDSPALIFPEFPVPLNNPPRLFPTSPPSQHAQHSVTVISKQLGTVLSRNPADYFSPPLQRMSDCPSLFPSPAHIIPPVPLSPSTAASFLSAAVIITCRSSNISDSVSLTDSEAAALQAAPNGYLINLSLQVQLGESDKLGKVRRWALLSACGRHG